MKSQENTDVQSILDALEAVRGELRQLQQRVTAVEGRQDQQQSSTIDQDLILAISGAVAAYLGEKPHIRQIRLVSGVPWVHQGRATIQASHTLSVHHHENARR